MTWQENLVTGRENHQFLVSASDFNGSPEKFSAELDDFLLDCKQRKAEIIDKRSEIRLGYIGVPPIFQDFYEVVESFGAKIVFNETQRQFAMLSEYESLERQYLEYTYPYGIFPRLEDISAAVTERSLDGLIHYTQSFCFRQIEDLILRKKIGIPVLTLEGDRPGTMDSRVRVRVEAFVEMLEFNKAGD